jgi:starvation-inducible outer membrane lipoprotein
MSIRVRLLALTGLFLAAGLALSGCKENPQEARHQDAVGLSQVPAAVKATIDQQAQGRSVGAIEKQTAKGTTRYAVALGSGGQKQELLIGEGGKVIATNADEDDD